ncbi:hypothetical protein BGZ94_001293 [Podila epigama]|nr:hypothetical protein BGZ94_001293 [Podila epigama]
MATSQSFVEPDLATITDESSSSASSAQAIRVNKEAYRVGTLPWEKGETPVESFAGHIPIRKWTQPDGQPGEASIWFQGGPGASSMVGLLYEAGPIQVTPKLTLVRNPQAWTNDYSMVFIDQPVGTGFSYVENQRDSNRKARDKVKDDEDEEGEDDDSEDDSDLEDSDSFVDELRAELEDDQEAELSKPGSKTTPFSKRGYVKYQSGVVADMLVFLDRFYDLFPAQKQADLYIAGQSYAGKFIPSVAKGILDRNNRLAQGKNTDSYHIRIKGVSLGNTMSDPISQIKIHADHAFFMGLINKEQADMMRGYQDSAVKEIQAGRYLEATRFRGKVFTLYKKATGNLNSFDIRKGSRPMNWKNATTFLNLPETKNALNIYGPRFSYLQSQQATRDEIKEIEAGRARTRYKTDPMVNQAMRGDIMRSVKPLVQDLLRLNIKVMAYQGIFDFRDAPAGSTEWIESLDWSRKEEFLKSERKIWKVDGRTAGYFNAAPGLTRIVVLGGGHYTPMDQPKNSRVMIQHLIDDQPLQEK